jgi:chemotaxis protein MotB
MAHPDDQSLIEDEGAGYLVSVSDIMAGLLFIFIITLVAFVIQFQYATDAKEIERQNLQEKVCQRLSYRETTLLLL